MKDNNTPQTTNDQLEFDFDSIDRIQKDLENASYFDKDYFKQYSTEALQMLLKTIDEDNLLSDVLGKVVSRISRISPEDLERLKKEIAAEQQERGDNGLKLTPTIDVIIEEETKAAIRDYMRQGQATNQLTKIKHTRRNTKIDPISNTATITEGSMTIKIPNYDEFKGLKTSTYKLLDALTTVLTKTGAKSPAVTMTLDSYMDLRGLKDRKEARKQVVEDLETLFNITISFKEKRNGKEDGRPFLDMHLCDSKGVIRNGVIYFSFGNTFFGLLKSYNVMPALPQLWSLNDKRNPNSYFLLRKLMEHKNMNIDKKNADIIAVKSLLEVCPDLPIHEEVKASNDRHAGRRIIGAFERDLDALADTLTWEYCNRNGTPLTDAELNNFDYEIFSKSLIHVFWKTWPDQTARLERKQARIEEAKEKKKRGRKPKAEKAKAAEA